MRIAILLALVMPGACLAGPFGLVRRGGGGQAPQAQATPQAAVYQADWRSTCQGVAEFMARTQRIGHFGGASYRFEGVGMAPTAQGAINGTCKPWFGGPPRETGVAQGRNGMWYACNRW